MNRKNKIRVNLGVLVVVLVSLIGWGAFGIHTVHKDSAYLQALVDKILPKDIKGVTVEKATILLADNKALVTVEVKGRKLGRNFQLIAEGVGVPDYKQSTGGTVFLRPEQVEVTHFSYDQKPPSPIMVRLAKRSTIVQEFVDRQHEKLEDWISETARLGALYWLEHMPVYKLNQDTNLGYIAHATLLDNGVSIVDDKLVLKFSFWKISLTILVGIVVVIILIAIAVICPEIFLLGAFTP